MTTLKVIRFCFMLCLLNKEVRCIFGCKSNVEFRCSSGQCISLDNLCDGPKHCNDGSDEIATLCLKYKCPKYLFRCKYGACIKSAYKCDGIQHCADNSDETPPDCNRPTTTITTTTTTSTKSLIPQSIGMRFAPEDMSTKPSDDLLKCILPEQPSNGRWSIFAHDSRKQAGRYVPPKTKLVYSCNSQFHVNSKSVLSTCDYFGNWNPIIECIKTCPTIEGSGSMIAQCSIDKEIIPCDVPLEGTIATLEYASDNLIIISQSVCLKGEWVSPNF